MRWTGGRRSSNIEDRRGQSAGGGGRGGFGRGFGGGFPGGFPRGLPRSSGGRMGAGGFVMLAIFVVLMVVLNDPAPETQQTTAAQDKQAEFVSVVLADTEDTWNPSFRNGGRQYIEPKLVLFTGTVDSGCGFAQAAMGPFYCPLDMKVYIDLSFYDELQNRFGAPGDFAQAYVVAHEIGHHVQRLLGTLETVQRAKQGVSQAQANALQVRVELQADCYAGVWAHHADRARGVVEPGDIDEALNAAAAIGDDRLQRQARGTVSPESFTHGTSEQRARWFRRGFEQGGLNACDTFNAQQL